MGKNYYVQVFLEKCRYVVKENKRTKFINADLEKYLWTNLMKRLLTKNRKKINIAIVSLMIAD